MLANTRILIHMKTTSTDLREARDFTPALPLLWAYDAIVAAFTRETLWRGTLLRQLDARSGDVIADLGSGTGSFLVLAATRQPAAQFIGIDPDDRILKRARRKLAAAGVTARLDGGYLRDAERLLSGVGVNKILSSLVFHQVPLAEKRAGLRAIHAALCAGGELHVADYGLQRTRVMRRLFSLVQRVDGYANTQPNADGVLPTLMREAGFAAVEETAVIPTVTGSISIYRAVKAG
jgi:cyclopropane fatty-acyl-phospholipid synthase-like methyltransferase